MGAPKETTPDGIVNDLVEILKNSIRECGIRAIEYRSKSALYAFQASDQDQEALKITCALANLQRGIDLQKIERAEPRIPIVPVCNRTTQENPQ